MILYFLAPVVVDEDGREAAIEFLKEFTDIPVVTAIDPPDDPMIQTLLDPDTPQVYVIYTPDPVYFCETPLDQQQEGQANYYIETPNDTYTRETLLEIWHIARTL